MIYAIRFLRFFKYELQSLTWIAKFDLNCKVWLELQTLMDTLLLYPILPVADILGFLENIIAALREHR